MNAMVQSVRSLWMPLQGLGMLVPNVAVAEVVGYQPLEVLNGGEDWCMGALRWRGRRIPVVSIEAMCGEPTTGVRRNPHLAIMNNSLKNGSLDFYAVVLTGIPRLVVATADLLGEAFDCEGGANSVVCRVRVGKDEAMIPNMPLVQERIEAMWRSLS